MTYHNKKVSSFKFQVSSPGQQGVTLLLAILVLSSILAISFSLATILLIEVKSSSQLTRSEASIYGANGVAEQAVFNLIRRVPNSPNYTAYFGNNVVLNGQPVVSSTTTPIFHDKVKANHNFTNTTNKYDFCAINNGSSGCQYGKVKISYLSGSNPIYAYLCQWDPSGHTNYATAVCSDNSSSEYWLNTDSGIFSVPSAIQLDSNTNSTVTWNNLNVNYQQELILYNPSTSGDAYVSIETFGPSPSYTPIGLPYVGQTAVTINTTNGDVGRKIQVIVPVNNSATVAATAHFNPDTSTTLSNSLISYWKLDEASGSRVDSVGSNTLADNNSVGTAAGKKATSGLFAAASSRYLSIADNSTLRTGDIDFTFGGWVYLSSKSADMVMFGKDTNTSSGYREYRFKYVAASDRFQFAVYRPTDSEISVLANNYGSPPLNTWLFVLAWHDSGSDTVNISVNNGSGNSAATGGALQLSGGAEFRVGARQYPGLQNYFDGRIDEFGFWKRLLTAQEKTDLYNSGNGNTYTP